MWVVLVVACLALLGLLGYRLFRRSKAFLREAGTASRRVSSTQASAQEAFDSWLAGRAADDATYLASLQRDVR